MTVSMEKERKRTLLIKHGTISEICKIESFNALVFQGLQNYHEKVMLLAILR